MFWSWFLAPPKLVWTSSFLLFLSSVGILGWVYVCLKTSSWPKPRASPVSVTPWPTNSYALLKGVMPGWVTGSPTSMGWSITVALPARSGVSKSSWMRPMLFSVARLCRVKGLVWVCLWAMKSSKHLLVEKVPLVSTNGKEVDNCSHLGVLDGLGPWAVACTSLVSSLCFPLLYWFWAAHHQEFSA